MGVPKLLQTLNNDLKLIDLVLHLRSRHRLKFPDAIIGASAISRNALIGTNNSHFTDINSLAVKAVESFASLVLSFHQYESSGAMRFAYCRPTISKRLPTPPKSARKQKIIWIRSTARDRVMKKIDFSDRFG